MTGAFAARHEHDTDAHYQLEAKSSARTRLLELPQRVLQIARRCSSGGARRTREWCKKDEQEATERRDWTRRTGARGATAFALLSLAHARQSCPRPRPRLATDLALTFALALATSPSPSASASASAAPFSPVAPTVVPSRTLHFPSTVPGAQRSNLEPVARAALYNGIPQVRLSCAALGALKPESIRRVLRLRSAPASLLAPKGYLEGECDVSYWASYSVNRECRSVLLG